MLEGLEPVKKLTACAVRKLMDNLDEKDSKILSEAVADTDKWPAYSLSRALRDRGLTVADNTITKHRNRLCICYKG